MKRILTAVILLVGFGIGCYQYMRMNEQITVNAQLKAQESTVTSEIDSYNKQLSSLKISQVASNTDLVSDVLNTDCGKIVTITALAKDSSGEYAPIISVDNVDDVAFFTNTVEAIAVSLQYEDFNKAYEYAASLPYPYSSVNFDTTTKIMTIRLLPITAGSSDIDNELTATPSSETVPATELLDANEASSEMDIQYLGGDSDETGTN